MSLTLAPPRPQKRSSHSGQENGTDIPRVASSSIALKKTANVLPHLSSMRALREHGGGGQDALPPDFLSFTFASVLGRPAEGKADTRRPQSPSNTGGASTSRRDASRRQDKAAGYRRSCQERAPDTVAVSGALSRGVSFSVANNALGLMTLWAHISQQRSQPTGEILCVQISDKIKLSGLRARRVFRLQGRPGHLG